MNDSSNSGASGSTRPEAGAGSGHPAAWTVERVGVGEWRGWRYPGAEAIIPEPLAAWCAALAAGRAPPGGRELKPGAVWACDSVVLKYYPPGAKRNAAFEAAARFRRCLPVPSPRPFVALRHPRRGSLLVSERIAGVPMYEVWERDPAAMQALPAFMALMHRHRVFHGDLHAGNALWDGRRWVLIDLDGLRLGRFLLLPAWRHIRRQWGQLHAFRGFPHVMAGLFATYAGLLPLRRDPARAWAAIENYARSLPAYWAAKEARLQRKRRQPGPGSPGSPAGNGRCPPAEL